MHFSILSSHSMITVQRTLKSSPSEQLNTTHCIAKALAKSFVVSVFPVPAGPAGAPPVQIKKIMKKWYSAPTHHRNISKIL